MDEIKLKKLETIIAAIEIDTPSTDEVVQLVSTIIQVVRETKEHLEKQAIENKSELSDSFNHAISNLENIEERMMKEMMGMHSKMNKKMSAEMNTLTKSLYVELKKLEDSIPAKADFTEIYGKIKEVESKIVPQKEVTDEEIVEKINTLPIEPEFQIEKEHIKGLVEELARIASLPRGGGGVSSLAVRQAFKYIFHTEEPTGAINGSNMVYIVANPIWAIIGFTLNGEQIAELPNYTFANNTITFATALPAAYSGKDFECKYIG